MYLANSHQLVGGSSLRYNFGLSQNTLFQEKIWQCVMGKGNVCSGFGRMYVLGVSGANL